MTAVTRHISKNEAKNAPRLSETEKLALAVLDTSPDTYVVAGPLKNQFAIEVLHNMQRRGLVTCTTRVIGGDEWDVAYGTAEGRRALECASVAANG